MLETLEDRFVPAGTFTWVGGTSSDWGDRTNWRQPDGQNRWPGQNNVLDDVVVLDNNATRDVTLPVGLTLAGLQLKANFLKSLTISNSGTRASTLTITQTTTPPDGGAFLFQSGTINLKSFDQGRSSASIALDGVTRAFWTGGILNGDADTQPRTPGTIWIYNNTTLTLHTGTLNPQVYPHLKEFVRR